MSELRHISPRARLAPTAVVHPFVCILGEVLVGAHTEIFPHTTIIGPARIGARVKIQPGCVIGVPGFGFARRRGRYVRRPHKGRVVIEDDVELGANCTVARATRAETRIGRDTKIDNLVHIGHNVRIGRNCIIIAQVGIAGSAELGSNVTVAGQVGIKDHVRIGDNSVVYAKSAVFKSFPARSHLLGIPARSRAATLRAWARLLKEPGP